MKLAQMEPKAAEPVKEKKPMTPMMAFLLSLFGYPGAAHVMLGAKGLGAVIIIVFTALTIGLLYEMYITISPLLAAYSGGDALENLFDLSVNLPRITFWIVSTGVLWVGSGVHAMTVAKKLQTASSDD